MTKQLYRHANNAQQILQGAAILSPERWALETPRIHLDTWSTLWRWHQEGQPMTRITDKMEDRLISQPLPPDLALATVPLRRQALACQLPEPGQWIVIARHPAEQPIQVYESIAWAERSPMLTYCASGASGHPDALRAGYINLRDQPTPAHLQLYKGTVTDQATDQPHHALTDADLITDDYLLTLAMGALFTPTYP